MLFRRRHKISISQKARQALWPRKGFSRPLRYLRLRILRLTATPHAIAAGVAAGVISAWTPFIGFHILLGIVLAWSIAGNVAAAALGTAFANPLTYPLITASTLELGNWMLGRGALPAPINLHTLFHQFDLAEIWVPFLYPMLVGSLPLGLVSGAVLYAVTFYGVRGFQQRRRERLVARFKARAETGF